MIAFPRLLLLIGWLGLASLAHGADRPADAILADYRAVVLPQYDATKKDSQDIQRYRDAYNQAEARRSALALELFQTHPEQGEVPKLLLTRWPTLMLDPATASMIAAEITAALPRFTEPAQEREARFMRAIATIQANVDNPTAALPVVDEFVGSDPKDRRAPVLLSGFASGIDDVPLRIQILKRLLADYPGSPQAESAQTTLDLLAHVGKPLDLEFVDAIRDETVSIQSLRGKVVVLDFWATWCGPCVAEMPRMKALYAEFHDQGVEFIGVSLDKPREEGGLDKLKAFVKDKEITWPQYYQGQGFESEFSDRMGITMIPQLFLIDAEGKLAEINARGKLATLLPAYLAKAKQQSLQPAREPQP